MGRAWAVNVNLITKECPLLCFTRHAATHAPPPAMPQSSGGGGFLSGLMGSVAQGERVADALE